MRKITLQGWITITLTVLGLLGSGSWALYGAFSKHVEDVAEIRAEQMKEGAQIASLSSDMALIKSVIIPKGLARGN